jgi:hypothetical protein
MPDVTTNERLSKAAQLFSEEEFPKAVLTYEAILHDEPANVRAINNAAIAYQKINRHHLTEDYLRRVLRIAPSHESAFYNLIQLLLGLNRSTEAALVYDEYQHHIAASTKKDKFERHLWPSAHPDASILRGDGSVNRTLLETLAHDWGNEEWTANLDYCERALKLAVSTDLPVLECGTGLTTLALAYLADQHDVEVWSLEHNATWYAYVSGAIERAGLDGITVCHTPLANYGDADWYDVSELDLPDHFGLILCDGPPGLTKGRRSGLFHVLHNRLAPACTILLDDVHRDSEMALAKQWASEGSFSIQIIDAESKQFAILERTEGSLPSPVRVAPLPSPSSESAYPPMARRYQMHLKEHPNDERIFIRLIDLLIREGLRADAAELFETYEANIPESPSKQAFRDSLFEHPPVGRPDHLGPICIGACGSSGTNLFRRLLDSHSQIACGKELSVFDRPRLYSMGLDELRAMYLADDFAALEEGVPFPLGFEDGSSYVGLRPGNYGDFYHAVPDVINLFEETSTVAEFLDQFLLRFAQRRGKAVWAEKTPNNIYCAEQFLDMYPKGRFIQVLRDGRDVCTSLNRRRNFSPPSAVSRWISAVEAGLRIADHKRAYTVRYENLVYEPEATLKSVLAWLGLPFEPGMLQFTEKKEISKHGYAEQPIHSDSAFRWKREWSDLRPGPRTFLDLSLRKHLVATGYEEETLPQGDSQGKPSDALPQISASPSEGEKEQSSLPPPIFVGGAGRSGTKLVRAILNAHPNITFGHELKITPQLVKAWRDVLPFGPHLKKHFGVSRVDVDRHFQDLIASFLHKYYEESKAKRIGEKTPDNAFVLLELLQLFPDSPVIHVIRDGRDVVRSMLRESWFNADGKPHPLSQSAEKAATYWMNAVIAGRSALRHSSAEERYFEVRYEDLVNDPEPVMRNLITHTGEPWTGQVMRFYELEDSLYPSVQRPISNKSVGSWRDELSQEDKDTIKRIAGDLLIDLGYASDYDW